MLDVADADGGSTLRVRVNPRASREGFGGEREGALVVRVTAPPVEGAANEAVARLVARAAGVPPTAVEIRRGASGRDKLLHVRGVTAQALRERLSPPRTSR